MNEGGRSLLRIRKGLTTLKFKRKYMSHAVNAWETLVIAVTVVGQASSPTVFHAMRRGATHRALSNIEVPRAEQLMPCVHCLTEAVLLETCL